MAGHEHSQAQQKPAVPKRRWEKPMLTYVGNAGEVLQSGGGKMSPTGGDPGENRKESGSGR